MTDQFPGLASGAFPGAEINDFIADEAIIAGSPVIYVAPGTGELKPRVEPTSTQGGVVNGVAVEGDNRGTYDTAGTDGQVATAAGQGVTVCLGGICKVQVNASANNIAIGDPLTASASDGIAELAQAADIVFGRAMQASTLDGDFILCEVDKEGVL